LAATGVAYGGGRGWQRTRSQGLQVRKDGSEGRLRWAAPGSHCDATGTADRDAERNRARVSVRKPDLALRRLPRRTAQRSQHGVHLADDRRLRPAKHIVAPADERGEPTILGLPARARLARRRRFDRGTGFVRSELARRGPAFAVLLNHV